MKRVLDDGLKVRLLSQGEAAARVLTRRRVERFVSRAFDQAYGAKVSVFLPLMLALFDRRMQPQAALGMRQASGTRLYLEQYLETPVEQALAAVLRTPVDRAGLLEVGNLAASTRGGARLLIAALTAHLDQAGLQWAVFTATPLLQRSFERLGIELVSLADADPGRLPAHERALWGRYYDRPATVMAANVAQSAQALRRCLGDGSGQPDLALAWSRARLARAA